MALVARVLIDEARDLHASFHRRDHPDKVLLRECERYERQLLYQAVQTNEDYLLSVQTVTLPLPAFDAGIQLDEHLLIHSAEYSDLRGAWHELQMRPMVHRHDPASIRTVFIGSTIAYLRGEVGDWNNIPSVRFNYTARPAGLPTLDDVLTIGDSARPAIVGRLAYTMAKKGPSTPDTPIPNQEHFRLDWESSQAAYISEVASMRNGNIGTVREVW